MASSMGWVPSLAAAVAHHYISNRSIVLALLLARVTPGDPAESPIFVQSQVEAYMLTLLALAPTGDSGRSFLPVNTSSGDSLAHTRARKAVLLEHLSIPRC